MNTRITSAAHKSRVFKVAPVTRAVRAALGVSVTALALGTSSGAFAADCRAPQAGIVHCEQTAVDTTPVVDLTLVLDGMQVATAINENQAGDIVIDNLDPVTEAAVGAYNAIAISAYSTGGNVDITNQLGADLSATSDAGFAIGIYGYASVGDVGIDNAADITTVSTYGLADGIFASGANVDVSNSGTVSATGYYWATGVEAQGSNAVSVTNSGDISAAAAGFYTTLYGGYGKYYALYYANGGDAHGIYATGGAGGAVVDNSGTITVQGGNQAHGIYAGSLGDTTVTNSGDIVVSGETTVTLAPAYYAGYYYKDIVGDTQRATGIFASSVGEGALVSVDNSGSITAYGYYAAHGIVAQSTGLYGEANVVNSGAITVSKGSQVGPYVTGIAVYSDGDTSVDNSGSISAHTEGGAQGIYVSAFIGDVQVNNSGDIDIKTNGDLGKYHGGSAYGISVYSSQGEATVYNSGRVSVSAPGSEYDLFRGNAIQVATAGDATAINTGELHADGKYKANGMYVVSYHGDATAHNTEGGVITFDAISDVGVAFGAHAAVVEGNAYATNDGTITGVATLHATGLRAKSLYGPLAQVVNNGSITLDSETRAAGLSPFAGNGISRAINRGDITVTTRYLDAIVGRTARGFDVYGSYSEADNSGSITATAELYAIGMQVSSDNGSTITNSGDIRSYAIGQFVPGQYRYVYSDGELVLVYFPPDTRGSAKGIQAISDYGDVTIDNSGSIEATSVATTSSYYNEYTYAQVEVGVSADAFGITADAPAGDVTINNSGSIHARSDLGVAAAVAMSAYGTATLNNNAGGSLGASGPEGSAFAVLGSDGVEVINNAGTITGDVSLLGGNDTVNNLGGGLFDLTNGSLDLGDGDDTINNGAGGTFLLDNGVISMGDGTGTEAFGNAGTINAFGSSQANLGGGSLVNDGVIDFIDGATDDLLSIVGDLGGNGALNLDLDLSGLASDQLYVDGNLVDGAVQTVNINSFGLPTTASTPVTFARFSGTAAGSFVGGEVLNQSPGNFIAMDVAVTRPTANTFAVGIDVVGLNDTGTLAAAVASGAANLLNTQIGTFTQRMGVNPFGDDDKVISAFVRGYSSEGDVDPAHQAFNFGQGGNFAYNQKSWGREIGINANVVGNLHVGLTLGSAEGRQTLTGSGVGENRLDGNTVGLYATWFAPQGLYVDVSNRKMAVDVHSSSAAGTLPTRVRSNAWNLEAGYQWSLAGLSVVPQLQYTLTRVEDVAPIIGDQANFEAAGGTASRARVGVQVSKTFQTGDIRWMPYGSLNAIRQSDGELRYTVADTFVGSTSTDGTSTMAELGLGVEKGGWGFSIGANWLDGGAFNDTVGGQAVVRFAW